MCNSVIVIYFILFFLCNLSYFIVYEVPNGASFFFIAGFTALN